MNYKTKVLPILKEAEKELQKYYGNVGKVENKSENPADVVTELDKNTETLIAKWLKKIDPTIEFVGEEFGGNQNADRFWLCDPIDGTAHFVRGMSFCTIMLCLVENGEVVFAAINDFTRGDMYWAEKGKGAWKNSERIRVSSRPLNQAYVFTEVKNLEDEEALERYLRLRKQCIQMDTVSAGYEYIMAASGRAEGRITLEACGKIWDYAPGSLLVTEAGGVVANIGKATYDYRLLSNIAVNPVLYKELTQGKDAIFPVE